MKLTWCNLFKRSEWTRNVRWISRLSVEGNVFSSPMDGCGRENIPSHSHGLLKGAFSEMEKDEKQNSGVVPGYPDHGVLSCAECTSNTHFKEECRNVMVKKVVRPMYREGKTAPKNATESDSEIMKNKIMNAKSVKKMPIGSGNEKFTHLDIENRIIENDHVIQRLTLMGILLDARSTGRHIKDKKHMKQFLKQDEDKKDISLRIVNYSDADLEPTRRSTDRQSEDFFDNWIIAGWRC
ncbi:hypothetical protein PsorP6_015227 [Peronosclerospora sorghi]|uniref:Uncharacterized protein n=1 Tax=Peronosclerospora sorghi TaxID=230839 RepID=A0ACC0VVD7_9STRA|nr:hypothetical protein PsorP6_015227 [Peronosclerospora sorghi]